MMYHLFIFLNSFCCVFYQEHCAQASSKSLLVILKINYVVKALNFSYVAPIQ